MKANTIYRTVIPSNIACIGGTVNDIVYHFESHAGELTDCELFELKVILNELIINAVKHGNKEEGEKLVKVAAGLTCDHHAFFIVEDQGEGYNYRGHLDRKCCHDSEEDVFDIKETGRGILLVSNLCDKVRYNSKGNKVIVYKKISRL